MPLEFIDEAKLAVSVVKQANRTEAAFNFKDVVLKNYLESWVKTLKSRANIKLGFFCVLQNQNKNRGKKKKPTNQKPRHSFFSFFNVSLHN